MQSYCFIFVFQLLSITGAMESSIVGGKVAKPHSRPYMASLQINKSHRCGGILIREDFILTAAHCKNNFEMTAVLGAHDITKTEKTQQWIPVVYHPHPKYNGKFEYDIMLLELKENATLNKYVKTIGLPRKDGKIPAKLKCAVAGWGQTGDKRIPSNVLRETTEKTQFDMECKNLWREHFITGQMICTSFNKKTGGICKGDSGGPLICNSKPQGITSFIYEKDCNNPKYPHVFTKIHPFLPWIKRVMQRLGDAV